MISDFTKERKIKKKFQHPKLRPQGEFQLRNPNPDFMVSALNRFLDNSRKDMQNCSREQCLTAVFCGPFSANYARACKTAVLVRTVFQILFRISTKKKSKEGRIFG